MDSRSYFSFAHSALNAREIVIISCSVKSSPIIGHNLDLKPIKSSYIVEEYFVSLNLPQFVVGDCCSFVFDVFSYELFVYWS